MDFFSKVKNILNRLGIEDGEIVYDLSDDQTNDQGEVPFIEGVGMVDPIAGLHLDDRTEHPPS